MVYQAERSVLINCSIVFWFLLYVHLLMYPIGKQCKPFLPEENRHEKGLFTIVLV